MTKLRIYADQNSKSHDVYWCINFEGVCIDDLLSTIKIYNGMEVIIYYEDELDEFEWDGWIFYKHMGPPPAPQWVAAVDEASFRRIR